MLLKPPGMLDPTLLPHWPYAEAVDQALTGRGIPPGTVRIERTHSVREVTMFLTFAWDVSRCAGPGGIQLAPGTKTPAGPTPCSDPPPHQRSRADHSPP
ncbi:hypothetical protein J8N05_46145 [Streptomyces sp. BH-SS-21]|uniref:Uncharacterized protein n=1 Tax=Streptomyces liliiviolaceus TaxID=2823109 RepID=A0A941BC14_9ACTN|nr:hypothetical protein [Streptomyces liliiviolaceus]MBQ0855551.1 hypothetical protein [Streptomyces liliiviolaceus]